jgi:hypothetical protein
MENPGPDGVRPIDGMEYKHYVRLINKRTRGRYDVTPVFVNAKTFNSLIDDLLRPFRSTRVDEWIETGAQAKAAIRLIERRGGRVVGIACLCAERNSGTKTLFDSYNCRPIHAG